MDHKGGIAAQAVLWGHRAVGGYRSYSIAYAVEWATRRAREMPQGLQSIERRQKKPSNTLKLLETALDPEQTIG